MKAIETELTKIAKESAAAGAFHNAAASQYQLGMLYNLQGRWSDAGRSLISGLEELNNQYGGPPDSSRPWAMHVDGKLGEMDRDSKILLSGCRFQLGLAHLGSAQYDEAREHFQKSLNVDEAIGDTYGQELCRIGLKKCDDHEMW